MSRIKVTKKSSSKKAEKQKLKEWPAVVYFGMISCGLLSYLVVEIATHTTLPHPVHWLAGLVGGIIGIPVGWLWYRWRGDMF